ncbi:multiple epidermal growth factor-like domains protein 10 [Saccostrea cucullata]|uniref:multiple epidermal growth factor-like domains protein 10 n=1 Tax=Saccostrea cuccullata TaxID=36930 RepID=UPI002ED63EAE
MYGYKLYISNSTDFRLLHEAYLCYSHTGPELPELNVTHVCVSFARYVIFYNERGVPGCEEDGVYGSNCNETCPTNCQERRCYITIGTCAGCKDGWTGEKCLNACPAGKYGAECKNTCTDRCGNNTSCNHVTGQCEGCLSGWMGHDCNEICQTGTYGEDCEQNCSGNCYNNDTCYNVNGYCPRGCRDGFQGNRCHEQSVVDLKSLCGDQRNNFAGLTAGLVISLLINVGFCFLVVLYFIRKKNVTRCRKKENKKENDQPSYEVSDIGRSQQSSTSGGHLENHTYEDLLFHSNNRGP